MKTLLTFLGVVLAIVGAYFVLYGDDTVIGLMAALLSLALFVGTSDQVWSDEE